MDLVVGLGATGLSVARHLRRQGGYATFIDTREAPPGLDELRNLWPEADVVVGDSQLPSGVERVIVSPGIPDSHRLLKAARRKQLEVVSDVELFVRSANAPFVAITGSNGKSTVTTLLYHMCRAADRRALAGGNLGEPALDLLGEATPDIYVLELSSFQLQRTRALPAEVAVLLNVTPDHLDWHASEREYRSAKYRIYREARAAVVNRADPEALRAASGIARIATFGLDEPAGDDYGIRTENGTDYLARGDTLLLAARDLVMVGVHNRANALAALAAGDLLGLEMTAMLRVLREFPGLPHRMQFVARTGAVDYINDSKATNVAAAVASIESIDGPVVLIAGGDGKGGDFGALANAVEDRLRAAVLIGKDAQRIAAALDTVMPVYFAQDMQDAVTKAAAYAESDDTVLLAPACASLDQYANYGARGDAFCRAVRGLPQ
jgi:UDP-N-acetylmuramoylalanine--D-glutamate ligase